MDDVRREGRREEGGRGSAERQESSQHLKYIYIYTSTSHQIDLENLTYPLPIPPFPILPIISTFLSTN